MTLGQQAFEAAKKEVIYWKMKREREVIVLRLGAKRALFGFTQTIKVAMLIGNDNSKEEVKAPRKTKKMAGRLDQSRHGHNLQSI